MAFDGIPFENGPLFSSYVGLLCHQSSLPTSNATGARVEEYSIKAKTSAATTEGVAKCRSRMALKEVSSGSTCQ